MFYKPQDINDGLTCGICLQIFDEPRVLPCGNSACKKCIKFNRNRKFKCPFCDENHYQPSSSKGLPTNVALLKLIKTKVEKVSRSIPRFDQLKDKLEEIANKCDQFKSNLSNGMDQVKEHCLLLRNQVHLETDKLIEQAHQFNEKLIGEINEYEIACIVSFNSKRSSFKTESNKLLNEIKSFCEDKAKYLTQFRLDDKTVVDYLVSLNRYLRVLDEKEESLKKMKFGGKFLEFKKNEIDRDESVLGTLVCKKSFELDNLKEVDLKKNNWLNCSYILRLFVQDSGSYSALFYNKSHHRSFATFDKNGNAVNKIDSINSVRHVLELDDGYMFLAYGSVTFHGQQLDCPFSGTIAIKTDKSLNYKYHKSFAYKISNVRANRSNIIYADRYTNFYFCDLDFNLIPDKSIREQVNGSVQDFEINDHYLFLICNKNLTIFDLDTLQIVKEIYTDATEMKLLSNEYLYLFNYYSQMAYLHNQSSDCESCSSST